MIRFENITKKYKDTTILSNLSFTINKGELVAIIGASGCGKTTSLKMINRLIVPTSGKIFIDDEDISKKDMIQLRRNMGYVIQQTGLFPHMTIRQNIELIPKIEKYEHEKLVQQTKDLLVMVGLDPEEYMDRYPVELSGGQQQRVGVARAFATDPEIILMDEPFSALDPITRSNLQDELIHLQSTLRKTIVFVTHDMDEAIKLADRICIMDKGNIVQYDTPENILKSPANDFVTEFVGKNRVWTSPEYIKAEDIMLDHPVTCSASISLFRCVEKMRTSKVDSLMVISKHTRQLKGIISAKQITAKQDKSLLVSEVMTSDYIHVSPEDTILDVLKIVNGNNVSYIPVIGEDRELLGLITKSSLVTTLSQQYIEEEE